MPLEDFAVGHFEVLEGADHAPAFFDLMAAAMTSS
jgi:hypothetical protein